VARSPRGVALDARIVLGVVEEMGAATSVSPDRGIGEGIAWRAESARLDSLRRSRQRVFDERHTNIQIAAALPGTSRLMMYDDSNCTGETEGAEIVMERPVWTDEGVFALGRKRRSGSRCARRGEPARAFDD
jgi:hypothetical protein